MAFTPSGVDIALKRNPLNGKFTFDWDPQGSNKGNPKFNNSRENSVLIILHSHKRDPEKGTGGYYFDKTGRRGTFLYKVNQDRLATGGLLQGYSEDGGQQLISKKIIQTFTSTAQRLRPGSWVLFVTWSVPSGQYQQKFSF